MTQKTYIPVTVEILISVMKAKKSFKTALEEVAIDEILGLLALQNLPDMQSDGSPLPALERGLSKAFALAKKQTLQGEQDLFRTYSIDLLDHKKLESGTKVMYKFGIGLVLPADITRRAYLDSDGSWDFTFSQNYRGEEYPSSLIYPAKESSSFLTDEQGRVINTISADIEEPLQLQGYAGTGKTHIIRVLLDLLNSRGIKPKNVLILSYTVNQVQSLTSKLLKEYKGMTFGLLAARMLPREYLRFKRKSERTFHLNYSELADYYNIGNLAGLTRKEIVNYANMTVKNFCESADESVGKDHLPYAIRKRTAGGWQECNILRELVVKTAQDLWGKTIDWSCRDMAIPARDYHRIKIAAKLRLEIPSQYTHVIVDEAHDLTQAMIQIVDGSPQCSCISFGDFYQNLNGVKNKRSPNIRKAEVIQSYRSGGILSELVNPVIQSHPFGQIDLFRGNTEVFTSVDYYKKAKVPDSAATILVSDNWALWEWVQRVAKTGCSFELISYAEDLNSFVEDVLKLKKFGMRPTHWSIVKFSSWASMVKAFEDNTGFQKILKMLDRNYSVTDWQKVMTFHKTSEKTQKKALYVLGKAEDSRNREYDRLMLTPDIINLAVVGNLKEDGSKARQAKLLSQLYVAVTRVKFVLMAPIELRHWVEEVTGRQQAILKAKDF